MEKTLYRIYRPKNFDEIHGQDAVVDVLEKTAKSKNPSHAYLFSGSRGTGKTSLARIFANELNVDKTDVFEIDAASFTGVDDIRNLNKEVYTLPIKSKYKVYILDEVHMLSKSAFNAFLKTLEEPPEHVIFILATTELEKVPDTIMSRCIGMNFNSPNIKQVREVIERITKSEKRKMTEQSVTLIALMAEGSYRDAISILQKILTVSSDKSVNIHEVEAILGAPNNLKINKYIDALLDKNVSMGVEVLNGLIESGSNMKIFGKLVARKIRSALLFREGADVYSDEYDEEDKKYIEAVSKNENLNVELLKKLNDMIDIVDSSFIKQLPFEYLLL